ncbi:hypothetical protein [Bacillus sp. FJAT-47783]|uniref:hypothetical protein n=1 Tax=Bacillus sp. FJAT-47783 TaxID=2922712 RepID=UPI001FAE2048|nr:hypothetical protein [Bacillus sp. FJAT-47783]
MKNLLYTIIGIGLLFFSLPYLSVTQSVEQMIFSLAWLFFALSSIGGNLYAYLHHEKKRGSSSKAHTVTRTYKRQTMGSR